MADYGQAIGLAGVLLEKYYDKLDEWEAAMNGRKIYEPIWKGETSGITHEEIQSAYQKLKNEEESICRLFINAVNHHNRERIIEIADAVWVLRKRRHGSCKPFDAQRSRLLLLKTLTKSGEFTPTIRQVAAFLALKDTKMGEKLKVRIEEDGFSALRRKCKELGIPIAKARTGRPKRTV